MELLKMLLTAKGHADRASINRAQAAPAPAAAARERTDDRCCPRGATSFERIVF